MANIAILSTAHIHTRSFIENLTKATDGRRALVIWDDVADRGRRYAEQCGAEFEPDLKRVIRDRRVDGFLICAENTRHMPVLSQALKTGKPVFCEKPLCTTVADVRRVRALLAKRPAPLFCGYFQPHSAVMQGVDALLAARAFGAVTRVRFRNAHHAAYGHWFDNPDLQWFANPELAGGGALMDMGTHAVHLLRTLFGPVTEVWATLRNESGIYPAVDDFGIAHLRFASGVLGTVEAAWTQTGGVGGLEIVGAEKTLWNNGREYVTGAPKLEPVAVPAASPKPDRVDRLVAAIRGEIPASELEKDLAATVDAVAIMEAAYKSNRTGRWTRVASV